MKIAWIYLNKQLAAADALKDYASMVYIIENQPDVEKEVRERLTSVPSGMPTGMPYHHNPHAVESRLASSLDEIDVLKERYRRALEYMEWFQPAWNAITEDERFVLSEFYSDKEYSQADSVKVICDKYHIERSSAYKKKSRALAHLATLLYGR